MTFNLHILIYSFNVYYLTIYFYLLFEIYISYDKYALKFVVVISSTFIIQTTPQNILITPRNYKYEQEWKLGRFFLICLQ